VVLYIGLAAASAGEPAKDSLPVTATLVAKQAMYSLDLGGMTPEAYKKAIEDAVQAGKTPPAPPAVNLVLELTNTTDKDVQVWIAGTTVQTDLDLKGPGALSVKPRVFFPAIAIPPKAITLAAGKTQAIPIKALRYGRRGGSDYAYWTKAGEYTLAATYKTGIAPAPKGSKEARGGFGIVTLKTAPIKLKVEAK
jgi:hypothetical protein